MPKQDIHYGWQVSPYSAKTRSYLTYIGHSFVDTAPSVLTLSGSIKRAGGRSIMPTVQLQDGRWLQDSSVIIDHFESERTSDSIIPIAPTQSLASALLEVFADEWMPMAALHYRWHTEENARFAINEFARSGLPLLPRFLGRPLVANFAKKMKSYLPVLGVDENTMVGVESMVATVLTALEAQLSQTAFILGNRPCLGDFAMYGPIWAHLYRDPGSRFLFETKPNVTRWMNDLTSGRVAIGEYLPDDQIPEVLDPLFECIITDQWSWLKTLGGAIDDYLKLHPNAQRVPRALGEAPFKIRGLDGQRKLVTFVQWKAQRAIAAYETSNGMSDPWLRRVMGKSQSTEVCSIFETTSARFTIQNFKMVLE